MWRPQDPDLIPRCRVGARQGIRDETCTVRDTVGWRFRQIEKYIFKIYTRIVKEGGALVKHVL